MASMTQVRLGRLDELEGLRQIEVRAGEAFRTVGLGAVADDEPAPLSELAAHVEAATLWVTTNDADEAIGYAVSSVVDGEGHLDQVSVDPAHKGRGLGRILVEQVCRWAAEQGYDAVTLTTYRDVAWNGPMYERLGFVPLDDAELGPELAAVRAAERARGLDLQPRLAMRRPLTPGTSP